MRARCADGGVTRLAERVQLGARRSGRASRRRPRRVLERGLERQLERGVVAVTVGPSHPETTIVEGALEDAQEALAARETPPGDA